MSESEESEIEEYMISSSEESDEGEGMLAETAARPQIVVRGREPYQFEPPARVGPRQQNRAPDEHDEVNYDERLDNTDW